MRHLTGSMKQFHRKKEGEHEGETEEIQDYREAVESLRTMFLDLDLLIIHDPMKG